MKSVEPHRRSAEPHWSIVFILGICVGFLLCHKLYTGMVDKPSQLGYTIPSNGGI